MKVYIVHITYDWEDYKVAGVFTDKVEAEKYKLEIEQKSKVIKENAPEDPYGEEELSDVKERDYYTYMSENTPFSNLNHIFIEELEFNVKLI